MKKETEKDKKVKEGATAVTYLTFQKEFRRHSSYKIGGP